MKTSELSGMQLDWAVANAEGELSEHGGQVHLVESKVRFYEDTLDIQYTPSTDWAQGGPIIEREGIAIYLYGNSEWNAHIGGKESVGLTPLIAAMRCYVASKLGDEIDLPFEIRGHEENCPAIDGFGCSCGEG
jgi:hypothetical protein